MDAGLCRSWANAASGTGDEPASEARIFRAGWNPSTQGSVLFDEAAAKAVMVDFEKRAVDGSIDLEHLSLDEEARHFNTDSVGHYQLELRPDAQGRPELWMRIKWNGEGDRRVRARLQRYLSPAFMTNRKTKRVESIHNVALCANPATHGAQPLIAASSRRSSRRTIPRRSAALKEWKMTEGKLTAENLPAVLAAFELPPDTSIADVMAMFRAIAMAEAGEPEPTEDTPTEEGGPEEFVDSTDPKPDDEKPAAAKAFTSRMKRWSGKSSLSEASDTIETWREAFLELAEGRSKIAAETAKMEAGERRKLAGELVALGAELPATVWRDPTLEPSKLALSKRLLDEPIGDLRGRAAAWRAAKGKTHPAKLPPNGSPPDGSEELTELELRRCKQRGTDPKQFAASKARNAARKAG